MLNSIIDKIRELTRRFLANWTRFLAIHVVVSVLVFAVLTPLASLLLRVSVLLSGSAALSDEDILFFALTPTGFASLLALGCIFSIIVFLEYAALLVVAQSIDAGSKVTALQVLQFLAGRAARLFRLALQILLRVLLNLLPFAALLYLIYLWLLSTHDINFYLFEQPPEWRLAVALGAAVGAAGALNLLRLFVNWIFSLPLLLFSARSSGQCLADSRAAVRGGRARIGAWLTGWLAGSLLLTAAVSAVLTLAGIYLIPWVVSSVETLFLALGFVTLIGFVLYFGATFTAASWLSLLIFRLYRERDLQIEIAPQSGARALERHPVFGNSKVLVWTLAAGLVVALVSAHVLVGRLQFTTPTEIIAHRGASNAAPENTLAAVQAAIDSGAHWVEIDVQETADGRVAVIHDRDLKKVGGSTLTVAGSTLEQLRQVDIGSWFGPEFADQRVPSLEEVLELSRDRIGVNIELKYYGGEVALERSVIDIVERAGMADQVVAMSLSYSGIQTLHRMRPDWTVGLLSSVAIGRLTALDVDFLALNGRAATRRLIRQAHQQDKQVLVWTVNDPITMASMLGRGADGLITDEPTLAMTVLVEFEELEPLERLLVQLADFFDRPGLYRDQ